MGKNLSNTFGGIIYYRNIKRKNTQWEKPKKENKPIEKIRKKELEIVIKFII